MSIDQKNIYDQEHPPMSKRAMKSLGFVEEKTELTNGIFLEKALTHPSLGREFYFELNNLPSRDSLIQLVFNWGIRIGKENKERELRKALGLNR